MSEPSNPWVSGVSGLFTTEFYGRVRQYLTDDGVFGQWLHVYELDDAPGAERAGGAAPELPRPTRSTSSRAATCSSSRATAPTLPAPDWSVFQAAGLRSRPLPLPAAHPAGARRAAHRGAGGARAAARDDEPAELRLLPGARSRRRAAALPPRSSRRASRHSPTSGSICWRRSRGGGPRPAANRSPALPENPRVRARALASWSGRRRPRRRRTASSAASPIRRSIGEHVAGDAHRRSGAEQTGSCGWSRRTRWTSYAMAETAGTADEAFYADSTGSWIGHKAPAAGARRRCLPAWDRGMELRGGGAGRRSPAAGGAQGAQVDHGRRAAGWIASSARLHLRRRGRARQASIARAF